MVSVRLASSSSNASHSMLAMQSCACGAILSSPRYTAHPPSLLIDLLVTLLEVCGAMCSTFAPVSCHWSLFANARAMWSHRAPSPTRTLHGYSIVTPEPMLPPIHSIVPSFCTIARFVLRLYVSRLQFSTDEYRHVAPSFTKISTKPA